MSADTEAVVVELLRTAPALNGATASTDLVGYTAGPWLHVLRTGGLPIPWRRQDKAIITVAVYADTKGDALDLAWSAREAIYAGRGRTGHGLTVCDVLDDEGMSWSPDDRSPAAARYVFRVALITKPTVV